MKKKRKYTRATRKRSQKQSTIPTKRTKKSNSKKSELKHYWEDPRDPLHYQKWVKTEMLMFARKQNLIFASFCGVCHRRRFFSGKSEVFDVQKVCQSCRRPTFNY